MHIFKLKEGTKSYDWVKDVIDKERKQNAEYCDRIRKAIPFQLTRVIASYVNSTFSRKLEIYEFVVTPEEYETLDKEVWSKTYYDDNQLWVTPNLNNEEGRAIKEVMSSYHPNSRMPDEVDQFCGNCFWYSVDDDPRASAWCVKHNDKTSCFNVCKDHKF